MSDESAELVPAGQQGVSPQDLEEGYPADCHAEDHMREAQSATERREHHLLQQLVEARFWRGRIPSRLRHRRVAGAGRKEENLLTLYSFCRSTADRTGASHHEPMLVSMRCVTLACLQHI